MGVLRLRKPLAISILVHATFAMTCAALLAQRPPSAPDRKITYIEMEPFDPQSIARKIKKTQEDERSRKRIVQTKQGHLTERATPDAFLGEKTQTVDRESVSKNRITAMGRQAQAPTEARHEPKPKQPAEKKQALQVLPLSRLGLAMIPSPKAASEEEQFRDRIVNQQTAGMPQDYVKGFKESETTALNTKEFVFYGYFQRIRQRLDLTWNSSLREHLTRMYRSGRQLASDMDHTTRILVTLNSGGEITKVQVLEESGTRDLDDAAVKAFNRAGPFPNPPHGILDPTGQIQIRWDFVLRS